jgi:hypothetical protein
MLLHTRLVLLVGALAALALFQSASLAQSPEDEASRKTGKSQAPSQPTRPRAIAGRDREPGRPTREVGTGARTDTRPAARRMRHWIVVVRSGHEVGLRSRPGGRIRTRLGAWSEFGSRQALAVSGSRGHWLAVRSIAQPYGGVSWIDARSPSIRITKTPYSIHIDLSRRALALRKGGKLVSRFPVAIGRPGSPTPRGHFAVTDKLRGGGYGPYYGCCILALSARQPHLPRGWTGGDRVAIHGTNAPSSIGRRSSAGCPRAADRHLRLLMRRVPLGAPVFIRK